MMPRNPGSLAGRLYARLLLLIVVIGATMAVSMYVVARKQIKREADAQLITAANVLYALMQEELSGRAPDGRTVSVDDTLLSGEDLRAFETSANWRMFVIYRNGRSLLRSDTAPPIDRLPHRGGFKTVRIGDVAWRTYGLAVPRRGLLIQVGEHKAIRDTLIDNAGRALVIPAGLLIVGSAGLLWLAVGGGLLYLRRLNGMLSLRGPRDISRFRIEDWPTDLAPLIGTLNDLFARIDAALGRERQFTDDAAHQLRTPLAALKLQMQTLPRITDDAGRSALAVEMIVAVDRAARLVSRMLTLARLDAALTVTERVDVVGVVEGVMADQIVIADRAGLRLALEGGERRPVVLADPTALELALANLVENALKHSPAGGLVTIRIERRAGELRLIVIDEGPGIPVERRDSMMQRFHRGSAAPAGAGLGLAIVASAVRSLNGDVEFVGEGEAGFAVHIILPEGA